MAPAAKRIKRMIIIGGGEDDLAMPLIAFADIDTCHTWHTDVEKSDIRLMLLDRFQCICAMFLTQPRWSILANVLPNMRRKSLRGKSSSSAIIAVKFRHSFSYLCFQGNL